MTILGTPTEIYNFGTQYWITIISIAFAGVVVATVYLPVFTALKLNSVYEVRAFTSKRAWIALLILFSLSRLFNRSISSSMYYIDPRARVCV